MFAYKIRQKDDIVYLILSLYRLDDEEEIFTKCFECKSKSDISEVLDFVCEVRELCYDSYKREIEFMLEDV